MPFQTHDQALTALAHSSQRLDRLLQRVEAAGDRSAGDAPWTIGATYVLVFLTLPRGAPEGVRGSPEGTPARGQLVAAEVRGARCLSLRMRPVAATLPEWLLPAAPDGTWTLTAGDDDRWVHATPERGIGIVRVYRRGGE